MRRFRFRHFRYAALLPLKQVYGTPTPLLPSQQKGRILTIGVEAMRLKSILITTATLGCLVLPVAAQDNGAKRKDATVAKPMTEKERKKQQEKLRKELETPFKKW